MNRRIWLLMVHEWWLFTTYAVWAAAYLRWTAVAREVLEPIQEERIHVEWFCSGQAAQHDADHGQAEEGGAGPGIALEVAGQATVAADPGEGALDDPAFGQDNEAMGVAALDDLQGPRAGLGND